MANLSEKFLTLDGNFVIVKPGLPMNLIITFTIQMISRKMYEREACAFDFNVSDGNFVL